MQNNKRVGKNKTPPDETVSELQRAAAGSGEPDACAMKTRGMMVDREETGRDEPLRPWADQKTTVLLSYYCMYLKGYT